MSKERPLDPEEYNLRVLGKTPKQVEREQKQFEARRDEEINNMIDCVLGYQANDGRYISGDPSVLNGLKYAAGYSDLFLTDAMVDAVVDNDAIELIRLVREEIKSNIRHDVSGGELK